MIPENLFIKGCYVTGKNILQRQENTNTGFKPTKSNQKWENMKITSASPSTTISDYFKIAFHGMWRCCASDSDHWNGFKINTSACTKGYIGRWSPSLSLPKCKYTLCLCACHKVIFHGLLAHCCHWCLLCDLMEILNDPNDGTQECRGRCLTFLQKRLSPLQSHQRCISKASLEPESDCRKGIFATLTLTLPIQ